jgi:hypothetical protein
MEKIFNCDETGETLIVKSVKDKSYSYDSIHNMTIREVENFIMYVNENTFRQSFRNIVRTKEGRKKLISFAQTIHGRLYDIVREKSHY